MPSSTPLRVALRHVEASSARVVVAHVDADGHPWGWGLPGIHRMHLIPLTHDLPPVIIWLENMGVRTFELGHDPLNTKPDLKSLRSSVHRRRDSIERAWLHWCTERGWLDYSPRDATIILYAGLANEFVRSIASAPFSQMRLHIDTESNAARLEAPLNHLVWIG